MIAGMPAPFAEAARVPLPLAAVNRPGEAGYSPELQRHHLLPRQALGERSFQALRDALGPAQLGFDDFRRNGILLPASENGVRRLGLPLHLGPHRDYNRMVIERIGCIEAAWSRERLRDRRAARAAALMRVRLVQTALRRRILDTRSPVRFHRRDPLGRGRDFKVLDRLAEELWGATAL